jgi:cytochrome c oxidase subunit I
VKSLERLTLAHLWVAFAAFMVACFFGVWQMWARSPLPAPFVTPDNYFLSVTGHGVAMAYVLTTFFIMGFGYFTAEAALERPLPGKLFAWIGYFLALAGAGLATVAIWTGRASVLYTFYPPLTASPLFYIGLVLVVVGSWLWCVLMLVAAAQWKRANPGRPVPLAMFGTAANAVLWLWTTAGVAVEILFIVLPASLGWINTVDVGLTRTLFSWTLHPIVYFWLFPAYIAFYTMAPEAAGGRLYSDTLGRLSFILLIIYSLPVGFHHLLMDPQESTGFKFLQMFLTLLVTIPTFLTVFTIAASLEIAGRLRGGRGLFGWIPALPWERPMVLATGFSFVMLFFGGGGGLVNMAYGLNALVHNTSWVTAHFHLIFGGAVVIMYFAITYEIWPMLTGREPISARLQRRQLWLWFLGMMIMSLPWHWLGLHGQWRRVAQFDYSNPIIAAWGPWVVVSLLGGLLLLASALLFIWNLASVHSSFRSHPASTVTPYRFALAVHPPARVPAALNGFGLWNALLVFLMAATYGWPIAQQAFFLEAPHAVVHRVDRGG